MGGDFWGIPFTLRSYVRTPPPPSVLVSSSEWVLGLPTHTSCLPGNILALSGRASASHALTHARNTWSSSRSCCVLLPSHHNPRKGGKPQGGLSWTWSEKEGASFTAALAERPHRARACVALAPRPTSIALPQETMGSVLARLSFQSTLSICRAGREYKWTPTCYIPKYARYLRVINQTNKLLILLLWKIDLQNNLEGQVWLYHSWTTLGSMLKCGDLEKAGHQPIVYSTTPSLLPFRPTLHCGQCSHACKQAFRLSTPLHSCPGPP